MPEEETEANAETKSVRKEKKRLKYRGGGRDREIETKHLNIN